MHTFPRLRKNGQTRIFGRFLPENGCRPGTGPCLEFYLNSPESTPPEDLRTEVCVPIERG